MKSDTPVITLLGNNSGRNLGDAAILSAILDSLSERLPDAEFLVPSITPKFIDENYGEQYRVKGVNVMPWTGSLRLAGIPTLSCLWKSDAALICDGIIFGKNLWNPAFNFLITLVFLLPFAKLFGCKLVCYNCGIGPFPGVMSRLFARWVINGSDLITFRDEASADLAREIGVTRPYRVTGDAAFVNPVGDESDAERVASENGIDLSKPIAAINITKYIDSWLKPDEQVRDKTLLLNHLAHGMRELRDHIGDDAQLAVISTQPMDEAICSRLAAELESPVIDNTRYLSHDIQAFMRRCGLLVGMRFHSLVLSTAVGVPVVGLIYAPKVRSYMELIRTPELGVELGGIAREQFAKVLKESWDRRDEIREKQQEVVRGLTREAAHAADILAERYFQEKMVPAAT